MCVLCVTVCVDMIFFVDYDLNVDTAFSFFAIF